MLALASARSQATRYPSASGRGVATPQGGLLYFVDSTGDGGLVGSNTVCDDGTGHCTLRAAIAASNSHAGVDGIELSLPAGSIINLTQPLPDISDSVTITGAGANRVTVSAAAIQSRIFNVTTPGVVTLVGMKMSDGTSSVGGGILNGSGTVNLIACALSDNEAGTAGGIFNDSGTVNITNSTVSGNVTTDGGYFGGGGGGGIRNKSGTLNVVNSTISGNNASFGGGAISNDTGNVNVSNSTLTGNESYPIGGGIDNSGSTGVVVVKSSIIAGNSGVSYGDDVAGNFSSQGFNFIGSATASTGFTQPTDHAGTDAAPLDPKLDRAGLQENGGPTRTIILRPGSPAIDQGSSNSLAGVLITDQRGASFPRTFDDPAIANAAGGDGTDIGAVEKPRAARGDFNTDGGADYLLFHSGNRRTAIWHLQGNVLLNSVYGPTLPVGWVVSAIADINLDGRPDYVLVNASTRQTAFWFLNDSTVLGSIYGPTLPAGWTLIAAADFNADGHPDYMLFNASTRRTAFWFLNGAAMIGTGYGPTLPAGWRPVDAQDFNSDTKPDLLLTNTSTRQSAIWYLNGAVYTSGVYGPTLPAGWTLQGTADFNGDRKPDDVLFEASTRRTALWYLNGAIFAGSEYGPTLAAGYGLVFP